MASMEHNADRHTRNMYDALMKESAEDNEKDMVEGGNPLAGKEPAKPDCPPAGQFSDAAREQFIQGRQKMLEDLFDEKKPSTTKEQALLGTHLAHGASGKYETGSVMLEKKACDETLGVRVQRLLEK